MGRGSRSASAGSISFVRNEQSRYLNYEILASGYPGWSLADIRGLTVRERQWWMKLLEWKKEKAKNV